MNILFLDDSRERTRRFRSHVPNAIIVHTSPDAIAKLASQEWDYVFLDHDLGDEVYVDSSREDCGMAVVRWVTDEEPIVSHFVVHSLNAPAREEMVARLQAAGYDAQGVPYINLYDSGVIASLE